MDQQKASWAGADPAESACPRRPARLHPEALLPEALSPKLRSRENRTGSLSARSRLRLHAPRRALSGILRGMKGLNRTDSAVVRIDSAGRQGSGIDPPQQARLSNVGEQEKGAAAGRSDLDFFRLLLVDFHFTPMRRIAEMNEQFAPRILISRMSAIGDAILTLPLACAIREHFPQAYIGWVVERKAAPMVRDHVALNSVIELERGWFTSPRGIRAARNKLRSHQFDISIDCQGLTKSSLAGWLSGAKRRIGFAGRHGGELSRVLNNELITPVFQHLTDRTLELLIPLEIHSPKVRWKLPIEESARHWASQWRNEVEANSLAILNPGATWNSKLWDTSRFALTARYLRDTYQYKSIIVWGSPSEQAMAEEIVELSGGAASIAPPTSLHQLAAMIEASDLFISGDTGPLHLAVAVGTSTIGLYGATRPGDSGPYGQIALQQAYEAGSRRHRRRADNSAMRKITVDHVARAIDQLEQERTLLKSA